RKGREPRGPRPAFHYSRNRQREPGGGAGTTWGDPGPGTAAGPGSPMGRHRPFVGSGGARRSPRAGAVGAGRGTDAEEEMMGTKGSTAHLRRGPGRRDAAARGASS